MSALPILEQLGAAVDALHALAEFKKASGENQNQYSCDCVIPPTQLSKEEGFRKPVRTLVDAGFKVTLTINAYGGLWEFSIESANNGLQTRLQQPVKTGSDQPDQNDAFSVFEELKGVLDGGAPLSISPWLGECIVRQKLAVDISLSTILFKEAVQAKIKRNVANAQGRVILFLFPENLAEAFGKTTLADLEARYFTAEQCTVFVVPGMRGRLTGDLISICGRDQAAEIEHMLSTPLSADAKQKIKKTLDFCEWQCVWPARPEWLTPEIFSVGPPVGEDPAVAILTGRLASLRSLLSILYLARRNRLLGSGNVEVNFGSSPGDTLEIVRSNVTGSEDVFNLYRFSYDGTSSDKLEIVRQLLAPIREVASLFGAARTVLESADKTHGRYLKKKVDEYFEARRKTRDYVQEVVREAESSTVKMTQEVAESVYKTLGAVALVIFAQALDPKLTPLAALLAAVALSVYLGVVLFYYLQTMRDAQDLHKHQFADHVRSFKDVLGADETTALLNNKHVKRAQDDFRNRRNWAKGIYGLLFIASLSAAAYYGKLLATEPPNSQTPSASSPAVDSTPTPGPTAAPATTPRSTSPPVSEPTATPAPSS